MTKKTISTLIAVSIFSIAMGFMESAVVVYLRELYYPEGFAFPIKVIDGVVAITEIIREFCTIVMLLCIGFIAGKIFLQRFAYFIFSFAIWDIFYYVFLKALLNWPESFFTYDLLFLLPVVWVGPVIAPILCSLAMIWLALIIIFYSEKNPKITLLLLNWILLFFGSFIIIISFTADYLLFVNKFVSITESLDFAYNEAFKEAISQYIPKSFNWTVFSTGFGIILFVIIRFWYKIQSKLNYLKKQIKLYNVVK